MFLRNAIPVDAAKNFVDDCEITPAYSFEYDNDAKKVKTIEAPFIVKDDEGIESYSLLAPPVAIALIKQLVKTLDL